MTFKLDWTKLLSTKRSEIGLENTPGMKKVKRAEVSVRTPFEHDYDRVVFSSAFRRLAKKTQVHPFAEVDHIHNRLTHSFEVASVGRSMAAAVGRRLARKYSMPAAFVPEDLMCIVQTACLAHDIGNPPFGHAGEEAIREWTKPNAAHLFGIDMASDLRGVARDWLFFEGNAQSFRMVSRADSRPQVYFRFSYATLGAMVKYPWDSCSWRVDKVKKFNVFSSEKLQFDDVVQTLGLRRPDGEIVRHPLSFLAEAADDICYRIGDFEDAVGMHILQEKEVRKILTRIIGEKDDERPLAAVRAKTIGKLVDASILAFETAYPSIMDGSRDPEHDLKKDLPVNMRKALKTIKDQYESIFNDRKKVAVELGAYNTLGRILGSYSEVVKDLSRLGYNQLSFVQKRYLELAWGEAYVKANQSEPYSWWLARVLDFVSGMTDNYAVQVSGEISGTQAQATAST